MKKRRRCDGRRKEVQEIEINNHKNKDKEWTRNAEKILQFSKIFPKLELISFSFSFANLLKFFLATK